MNGSIRRQVSWEANPPPVSRVLAGSQPAWSPTSLTTDSWAQASLYPRPCKASLVTTAAATTDQTPWSKSGGWTVDNVTGNGMWWWCRACMSSSVDETQVPQDYVNNNNNNNSNGVVSKPPRRRTMGCCRRSSCYRLGRAKSKIAPMTANHEFTIVDGSYLRTLNGNVKENGISSSKGGHWRGSGVSIAKSDSSGLGEPASRTEEDRPKVQDPRSGSRSEESGLGSPSLDGITPGASPGRIWEPKEREPPLQEEMSLQTLSSNPSQSSLPLLALPPPAPPTELPQTSKDSAESIQESTEPELQDESEEKPQESQTGTPSSDMGSEFSQVSHSSQTERTEEAPVNKRRLARTETRDKIREKRSLSEVKDTQKALYPPNLPPFGQPREALNKTMLQLENPEWEVSLQGLQGMVRLSRHHPKLLLGSVHALVGLISRQVRNLRSQVARAACQAALELFKALGRALDTDTEDLAAALLSRMADTNRFLRADSNAALESMVDNISPVKSIAILVNKGSKHQNAVVRGATCRLLLRLCTRLGPERTLSLPRDSRDAIILTGAKCLTEGSLDTRRYAKDMFALLSADNRLHSVLREVIPSNIMRSISKTLARVAGNFQDTNFY